MSVFSVLTAKLFLLMIFYNCVYYNYIFKESNKTTYIRYVLDYQLFYFIAVHKGLPLTLQVVAWHHHVDCACIIRMCKYVTYLLV